MIIPTQITIENRTIDIASIEANARKMRAEAMAEFGRNFRDWFKSLDFKIYAARVPH